jgi:hypothetical protein
MFRTGTTGTAAIALLDMRGVTRLLITREWLACDRMEGSTASPKL